MSAGEFLKMYKAPLGEKGFASVAALTLLTVIIVLGIGVSYLAHGAWEMTNEQLREAELRLAAESGIEVVISEYEAELSALNLPTSGTYESKLPKIYEGKIKLVVQRELREEKLYLTAVASEMVRNDGEPRWQRAKKVRAIMRREGDRYAWVRWIP